MNNKTNDIIYIQSLQYELQKKNLLSKLWFISIIQA